MKYFKVEINNEISFGKLQKNAARKVHFLHRDDDDEEEEFAKISSNRHCETFLDDTTMMDQPVESSSCSSFIATINNDSENDDAAEEEEEEDYSASVNAIIKRRNSSNKKKLNRKEQSLSERRCSSVYTTSSAETAITIEETQAAGTSEVDIVEEVEVYNKINLHKEVLNNIKMQPWNMRKKIKLVIQAKNYIKKHEGQLQERLAQSHSTKDMLEKWNIVLIQKWQKWKRELTNMSMWFIPWELKIKEIESHFGSVVASYFLFLRWLFWVNIVISVVIISFVTIPEIIATDAYNQAIFRDRKLILPEEKFNSTNLFTIWDFKGILKYSPLFYGWYTNRHYNDTTIFTSFNNGDGKNGNGHHGYRLPFAYFITGLMVYAYSFFATLRKMAENSRMSKLSEKDDECIFSWKLFTAWDYMIGNAETAHNRVASIIMGFKEALLEEAEKHKESRNWRVICIRILINGLFLGLLTLSVFAVVIVVKRSTEPEVSNSVWRQNEITLVLSLITFVFPMLFEFIGRAEQYHPRKQLRLQLTRVMILNLLNLYSLIFALFDKINGMTKELQEIKANLPKFETALPSDSYSTSSTIIPDFQCFCSYEANVEIINNNKPLISLNLMLEIVENLTSSVAALDNIDTSSSSSSSSVTDESIFKGYFKNSTEYLLENFTRFIFDNFTTYNADENFNFSSTLFPSTNLSENFTEIFQNFTDFIETNRTFEYLTEILENITASSSISDYEEFTKTSFTSSSSTEVVETATTNFPITEEAATQNIQDSYCYNFCKKDTKNVATKLNYSMNAKLRNLCWETMFGQELIKLTVMDLILTGLSILALDFFRGIFVRVMNRCWCWDIEKKFPSYGDFKVAENILHLVNNQGMVWMGMFFAPGLVVLNVIKLFILMYLRSWAVLTCNVPHSIIFRASRSNNFYYALLLMMLFLCVLPVGYAIVWIEPSWHCGPFSGYARIFHIFTKTIRANVPQYMHRALDYVASPGIVIPLLLLLILIIYYLVSLTGALREANIDLKTQLRRERTEERRKMFKLADQRHRGDANNDQTPLSKWKKLLFNLPSNRSYEDTTTMREESDDFIQSSHEIDEYNNDADAADADDVEEKRRESKIISKVFFSKLIKKALGKTSSISQDDVEEQTDIDDQHESLPDDEALEFRNLQNIVRKWSSSKRKNFANKDVERQDSSSSSTKWSENIPVIKIISSEPSSETIPLSIPSSSNKPSAKTIKCSILQKTEAIDEI